MLVDVRSQQVITDLPKYATAVAYDSGAVSPSDGEDLLVDAVENTTTGAVVIAIFAGVTLDVDGVYTVFARDAMGRAGGAPRGLIVLDNFLF